MYFIFPSLKSSWLLAVLGLYVSLDLFLVGKGVMVSRVSMCGSLRGFSIQSVEF